MKGIAVSDGGISDEEDSIQAVQTNVDRLRKELKIVDTDPQSIAPSPTLTQAAIAAITKTSRLNRKRIS